MVVVVVKHQEEDYLVVAVVKHQEDEDCLALLKLLHQNHLQKRLQKRLQMQT